MLFIYFKIFETSDTFLLSQRGSSTTVTNVNATTNECTQFFFFTIFCKVTTIAYTFLSQHGADTHWPKELKMAEQWENIKKANKFSSLNKE